MRVAEFPGHLTNHIIKIISTGAHIQKFHILLTHASPVHAAHLRVIKEIPVKAPSVIEDLSPFGARIDFSRHGRDAERLTRSLIRGGIYNRECVIFTHEKSLAVGGEPEIAGPAEHGS